MRIIIFIFGISKILGLIQRPLKVSVKLNPRISNNSRPKHRPRDGLSDMVKPKKNAISPGIATQLLIDRGNDNDIHSILNKQMDFQTRLGPNVEISEGKKLSLSIIQQGYNTLRSYIAVQVSISVMFVCYYHHYSLYYHYYYSHYHHYHHYYICRKIIIAYYLMIVNL